MTHKLYAIVLLICCSVLSQINAQEQKRIFIKYSGFAVSNKDGVREFIRDNSQQIHFVHEGIDMFCDKAIYYEKQDFIEAFSNVNMKQGDTINMSAQYVEYSGKTQFAFASGDVVLREPQSTLTTDTLFLDRTRQQAFYRSKGKVVRDSSGTITSQIGRYYMDTSKYQFVENVKLVNPDYVIDTDYLDFYSETGYAYLYGPSTITTEESKTYCEKGFYDTERKIGYAVKNSRIDYDNRIFEGDSMYVDNNRSFASATNNIKITDTLNNSIIKGHYAEIYKEQDSAYITKRAVAITVQENDSLYIHGDKLMVTGKPEHRITKAYYNVKLYKSDLAGKCDSLHSDQKTGLTQLINLDRFGTSDPFSAKRKPILWNLGNQMTGDSIHLISNVEKEELDSLKVFNNSFLISKDTLGDSDGFNQIKGQRLIGLFKDNELYNVDIIKNAEKIYYSRNENDELVGIDKSKSGSINIRIVENAVEEIRMLQQIDGDIFPETEFPENARKFKGFDWRDEERPKKVEDLFKDDPALELPVIKGLEDYVPQEEFFDEETTKKLQSSKQSHYISDFKKTNNTIGEKRRSTNLFKDTNNLYSSSWEKYDLKLVMSEIKSPNNGQNVIKITRIGEKAFGYLSQKTDIRTGEYLFKVMLRGKGNVIIYFQEVGDNYTRYCNKRVDLSKNIWKEYTLSCEKENDGNVLRITFEGIDKSDELFIWNPILTEIIK